MTERTLSLLVIITLAAVFVLGFCAGRKTAPPAQAQRILVPGTPEKLPPETVTVVRVERIQSPPETKIVETVRVETKPVPPDPEVVKRLAQELADAERAKDESKKPFITADVSLNRYTSKKGDGWQGHGACTAHFADGTTRVLAEADTDPVLSEAHEVFAEPWTPKRELTILAGRDAGGYVGTLQAGRRFLRTKAAEYWLVAQATLGGASSVQAGFSRRW